LGTNEDVFKLVPITHGARLTVRSLFMFS